MSLVTSSWLADSLFFVATSLFVLYWYLSRNNNYFKDRGIPYVKPTPFLGSWELFTTSQTDMAIKYYNQFENERFFGFFQTKVPCLVVKDPTLIQRILVKDFVHFYDRGFPVAEHDPLDKNLLSLRGQHWRMMRHRLLPTFTSGKLKRMFDQLVQCANHLVDDIENAARTQEIVEAKDFVLKINIEVIGSVAFGLDFGKNNPQGKEFEAKVNNVFTNNFRALAVLFVQLVAPKIISILNISTFPPGLFEYFNRLTIATKEFRRKNNIKRNDYFQLLLSLQEAEESGKLAAIDNSEEDTVIDQMKYAPQNSENDLQMRMFKDEDLTAQAFIFLTAGTESLSSTLSFALYQVSKNPAVEAKLKEEIHSVLKKHGDWTYQAVKEMTYLDQIIQETQRRYPVISLLPRECTIPYTIPDTNIVLEKGTIINIPIAGLHMDPRYYPDPEVFNPDRFADNGHKPSATFLPFGDGPRVCIAMRFAILEMKVLLAKIFAEYSVEVDSKTREPFVYDRKSFFPKPVGGIWIKFKKGAQKLT